jgi:alkylated DNA repair dioxygenase AlkB
VQQSLFGRTEPSADLTLASLERIELGDGAWLDHVSGWLEGHAELFENLRITTAWEGERRWMYTREVETPRLFGSIPRDGPGHPILFQIKDALSNHYRENYDRISIAYYRDGRDSVAWHGDRVGDRDCVIPILSVGGPRRFLLKRKGSKRTLAFNVGWGDLLVMGGSSQRLWMHAVPKQAHAEPRMAIMFRQSWIQE